MSMLDLLVTKISPEPNTGCWIWVGKANIRDYSLWDTGKGKTRLAHRKIYGLLVGPIPEDKELDHLCRNRWCVNPRHLQMVSHKENVLRGIGPTAINAKKTHCIHGHEFNRNNTGVQHRKWRTCLACKRESYHRNKHRRASLGELGGT